MIVRDDVTPSTDAGKPYSIASTIISRFPKRTNREELVVNGERGTARIRPDADEPLNLSVTRSNEQIEGSERLAGV